MISGIILLVALATTAWKGLLGVVGFGMNAGLIKPNGQRQQHQRLSKKSRKARETEMADCALWISLVFVAMVFFGFVSLAVK